MSTQTPTQSTTEQVEEVTAQLRLAHGQLAALESSLPGELAAAQTALAEREAVVRVMIWWWFWGMWS